MQSRSDLQLQAEGDAQHLEALHLKVNADRRLVVLIESVFAKPETIQDTMTVRPLSSSMLSESFISQNPFSACV